MSDHFSSFYHFSNTNAGRIFCVVGGFVDAAGFLLLDELFVASVTGNIVKYSAMAVNTAFGSSLVAITFAYGSGAGLTRLWAIYQFSKEKYDAQVVGFKFLMLEFVLLMVGMICGVMMESSIQAAASDNAASVLGEHVAHAEAALCRFHLTHFHSIPCAREQARVSCWR
jgi:Protein of unknown function (DUF1275)